ncbi:MAG: DUF3332 family protein [Leptospiraceae bacterium]|nr:DUF3332 family protein [Leptospiraceae bacterium]MCB1316106.1 DUF3332 family protein [Leptospiraceae bacterium]MCB1322278.1 DUF3332 family protein [Leptospiraceae bacterium]
MKRFIVGLMIFMTAAVSLPKCYGGFALTRKVHNFIGTLSGNKWINWIVFFVCAVFPFPFVYGIIILVDALILNSIEFWSGSNPMAMSDFDENGELVKRTSEKDYEAVFTYKHFGMELNVAFYRDGELIRSLTMFKDQPGQFYTEQDGKLQPIDVAVMDQGFQKLISVRTGESIEHTGIDNDTYNRMVERERAYQNMLKTAVQ